MPDPREDMDWYVDLSERLERREQRRKWIALAVCVMVPLLLMGGFVLYIAADRAGWLSKLKTVVRGPAPDKVVVAQELPLGPESVKAFQKGDIRFPQLDNEGLMTSINHYFREVKPDKAEVFTVNRASDDRGSIISYRLFNIGTTEVYDFTDVPVKKIAGEWAIAEDGWMKIRDELQARMKVRLSAPAP